MLNLIYKRAVKAGGQSMTAAKSAKIFADDSALRRNVMRACSNARIGQAIVAGTFADHRVIESLHKLGDLPAGIVLDVEAKLGRKLSRAKASALTKAYLRIVAAKTPAAPHAPAVPSNVLCFPKQQIVIPRFADLKVAAA